MEVQLTENIFLIEGKNKGSFPYAHSILIRDRESALIDTGCGTEILQRYKNEKIKYVINSHLHPDHTKGNWLFEGIYAHESEFEVSGRLERMKERFGFSRDVGEAWEEFVRGISFKPFSPDERYFDKDAFDFGTVKLEVMHMPGHCRGHCCFYFRPEKLVIGSDIDLTRFGPWYGTADGDIDEFISSIERLERMEIETFVSLHVGVVRGRENIKAKLHQYKEVFHQREEKILQFLEVKRTFDQIVDQAMIYGRFYEPSIVFRFWEGTMIQKHLTSLEKRGQIRRTKEGYVINL
jgi:glyoxylase-like metal-dependent hydrolase (beta-lactamase superfamily II)